MRRKTAARAQSQKNKEQPAARTKSQPKQKKKRDQTVDLTSDRKKSPKLRLKGASPPLKVGQILKVNRGVRSDQKQHDAAEASGGFLVGTSRRTCACCGGRAAHECAVCGVALHKPNKQCAWPCSDIFHNKTREGDCWIDYLKTPIL